MADRILTDGLYLFNTRINPYQCEQERIHDLLICFKCYKYEDHHTKDCPTPLTVCSECAEEGHTFKECKSSTKKCLNCGVAHRTLLAGCQYRKTKIVEKQKEKIKETNKQINQTYAGIAKIAMEEIQPKQINITRDTDLKMTALILEAHIAALSGRRKFGDLLSESMKLNFNIDVRFPDRNSQEIFNLYRNRSPHDITDSDISIDNNEPDQNIPPPAPSNEQQFPNKRKQQNLTPTNEHIHQKPQKVKRTESSASQKKTAPSNQAPISPTKSSTSNSNSYQAIAKPKTKIEYYIYKSANDKVSYKPLPSIEGIQQLFYKQKIKLGLPRPYNKNDLFTAIKELNEDIYYPCSDIHSLNHSEFNSAESIFSVKINDG